MGLKQNISGHVKKKLTLTALSGRKLSSAFTHQWAIRKGGKIIKEIGTFKPRREEIT